MRRLLLLYLTIFVVFLPSPIASSSYEKPGVTPGSHVFAVSNSNAALWRFTLGAKDCPPGVSVQAVATLPDGTPDGRALVLRSSTNNCPSEMTICADLWRNASQLSVSVDVVGEKGVPYNVGLEPIPDRRVVVSAEERMAVINGSLNADFRHRVTFSALLVNASGQVEFSVEADDVAESARGRKFDRKTKEEIKRFVATLVVGPTCIGQSGEGVDGRLEESVHEDPGADHMFLTFSTYGKITLSQNSIPRLRDGVWYVGVFPSIFENRSPKDFRLTVKMTPAVSNHAYLFPLILVSLFTAIFFILVDVLLMYVRYREFRKDRVKEEALSSFTFFFKNIKTYFTNCLAWFKRGPKTFSYLVLIFGVTLFIPGLQTITGTLIQSWETGDRDLCYYNERCYLAGIYDFPINSVVSNAAYVVHGVLLMFLYSIVETFCRGRHHFEPCTAPCKVCHAASDESCDYTLAYSLGWTLIFQGMFSGIYHLCPTRRAVQFDQSFMFVLAILIIVSVYRGSVKIKLFVESKSAEASPADAALRSSSLEKMKEMRSPKIFLFFLCPLVVFNYVGTLQNMKEIPVYGAAMTPRGKMFFGVALFLWLAVVLAWAAYKLQFFHRIRGAIRRRTAGERARSSTRQRLFSILYFVVFLLYCLAILYFVLDAFYEDGDMAKTFVGATIGSALIATFLAELYAGRFVQATRPRIFKRYLISILLFYSLVAIAWGVAFYFFKRENPSKKETEPWISRERNKECIVPAFFDGHDIWHICSSFGIFLTSVRVVHLSNPCPHCFKERFGEPQRALKVTQAIARFKRRLSKYRNGDKVEEAEGVEGVAVEESLEDETKVDGVEESVPV